MKRIDLVLAGVTLAMLLPIASGSARAQDPVLVNARTVHVKLENRHVRVLEATLQPGQKEQMHSHPATILYVISGGKVRNHTADGKTTEAVLQAGDVSYREPMTHWAENIGTTTVHLILVELKSPTLE